MRARPSRLAVSVLVTKTLWFCARESRSGSAPMRASVRVSPAFSRAGEVPTR